MNTFKNLTSQWKKAVVLGALTLVPTLAVSTQAQADPYRPGSAPVWSNQRDNDHRFDNRGNDHRGNDNWRDNNRRDGNRYDNRYDNNRRDGRYDNDRNYRNDNRFDPRRDDRRYDSRYDNRNDYRYRDNRRDNDDKKNTAKIIGAGVVGAILGAVISR